MLQYPNGNGRDVEINNYSLPILIQETLEPEREHRHGQRRDVHQHRLHPVPAERARPGQPVTVASPPLQRYVAHVMGMPVSLALRGRHADDERGARGLGARVAELPEVDRVFSTYRADSVVSRLGRGEIDLADCPAEVARGPRAGRAGAGGVRRRLRRTPRRRRTACDVLDPSGVVKGWAVQRASPSLRALPDTDVCLSAGGDMVCHVADASRPAWRIGIEDPHDPQRVARHVVPVRAARSPPPAPPTAASTSSTPAPATLPAASPRSPSWPTTSPGPTSTPPRRTPWAPTRSPGSADAPAAAAWSSGATAAQRSSTATDARLSRCLSTSSRHRRSVDRLRIRALERVVAHPVGLEPRRPHHRVRRRLHDQLRAVLHAGERRGSGLGPHHLGVDEPRDVVGVTSTA